MGAAEDQVALTGQIAVRDQRQRHAGVGAAVDAVTRLARGGPRSPGTGLALAEDETPRAGIGQFGESAEARARRRLGRVAAQGRPTDRRQARISTRSNSPALA